MVTDETDKLDQSDAEPVAWRVKDFADGWIIITDPSVAARAEIDGHAAQPLYTTPPRLVANEGGRAALAQSDADPVAWLVRVHGDRGMSFATVDKPSAYLYAEKHPNYSVEPLFTALPSTADALKNENRRSSTQPPKRLPARR